MANFTKQLKVGYPSTLVFEAKPNAQIKGVLLDYPKTVYFNRIVRKGQTVEFPLPSQPEQIIVSSNKPIYFVTQKALETVPAYLPEKLNKFIPFAKEFANEASYLLENTAYESDHEKQKDTILFLSQIYNVRNGRKVASPTPARISRKTGIIQINAKAFKKMTVPQRMFILLHEYMHFILNSSSEFEVDLQALRAYLSLGFSRIESVYALTKILHDSEFSLNRVKLLINYIKKFEA